jgi:uncharacterized membrane protein
VQSAGKERKDPALGTRNSAEAGRAIDHLPAWQNQTLILPLMVSTDTTNAASLGSSRRRVIITFLIAGLLAFASKGFLSAYSYWGDEIFSVIGSKYSWGSLIPTWVMKGDVHPPLYHILLKGWMDLFGDSEIATRSLSFLCGSVAIIMLALFTAKRSFIYQLMAVLLLGTSPAFAYYMQETRSYALVLLLAMALTICSLDLRTRAFHSQQHDSRCISLYYILSIALSLTHYFGWILVFCFTLINLGEARIETRRWKSIALLVLISIWPAIHVLYGSLGEKTGGNFWIESGTPILSSINNMLLGVFPLVLVSREPLRLLLLAGVIIFLVRYGRPLLTPLADLPTAPRRWTWLPLTETAFLALTITLFVGLLIVIDFSTPMSTPRNYIVLLPSVVFLLAGIFDHAIAHATSREKKFLFVVAAVLLLVQLYASQMGLREKATPRENWKGLAEIVKSTSLCRDGCYSDRANTYFTYYFQPSDLIPLPNIAPGDTATMKDFLAEAIRRDKSFMLLDKTFLNDTSIHRTLKASHVCLEPRQAVEGPVLVVPSSRSAVLLEKGLLPCRKG